MTTAVAPTVPKLEDIPSNASNGPPPCPDILQPGTGTFSVSPSDFLASRPDIDNVLAGAMVFRPTLNSSPDNWAYETLLLRRSASDTYPLKWEIPAGTADPELDSTIVSTAVRELWEETGLRTQCIICPITLGIASNAGVWIEDEGRDARMDPDMDICLVPSAGKTWAVATFLVMVDPGREWKHIKLRPEEHSEFAWVTLEEVRTSRMKSKDGAAFDFVSEAMRLTIIEGFRMRKLVEVMVEKARSKAALVGEARSSATLVEEARSSATMVEEARSSATMVEEPRNSAMMVEGARSSAMMVEGVRSSATRAALTTLKNLPA